MARRCFEVSVLKFKFCDCNEARLVTGRVKAYLERYASNTSFKSYYEKVEEDDIVIRMNFSKSISVNTVNNIMGRVFMNTNNVCRYTYDGFEKIMTVAVLK